VGGVIKSWGSVLMDIVLFIWSSLRSRFFARARPLTECREADADMVIA
jgi:hypothetical protein